MGSGVEARGRVKVSAEGELSPRAEAPFSWLAERPKAEALGYLEAAALEGAAFVLMLELSVLL